MAHNVKIDYYVRENNKVGTHSYYAQPIPNGTYGFEQICEQAGKNTTIEAHTIAAAVKEYMRVVQEKLCDGFRAEVGQKFITLGPNLRGSVKDYKDEKGQLVVVTAKDLTANKCKSRVSATVHPLFSSRFEESVSWRKTDKQGNALDEEDATLDNTEEQNPNVNEGGSSSSDDGDNGTSGGGNGNGGPSGGGGVDQN